uniref:Ovule protein n=1 Tax=Mesocestoides corti TaxID=53468 RepID=A0A5K3FHW5_MESCO
ATAVVYPSPNRKKIGTTEHSLLTNNNPGPHVRRLPSESTTLATPLIIYCMSSMSFSGWLHSFPACHWIAERHGIGRGQVVQYVCALIRRNITVLVLVLVVQFSRCSFPGGCNKDEKLLS